MDNICKGHTGGWIFLTWKSTTSPSDAFCSLYGSLCAEEREILSWWTQMHRGRSALKADEVFAALAKSITASNAGHWCWPLLDQVMTLFLTAQETTAFVWAVSPPPIEVWLCVFCNVSCSLPLLWPALHCTGMFRHLSTCSICICEC